MNREEFLRQLKQHLATIPENDRLDAIAYYNDYFDEAGAENEQEVIRELGSPAKVAQTIIEDLKASSRSSFRDYSAPEEDASYYEERNYEQKSSGSNAYDYRKKQDKKNIPWVAIIIIAVLTFPVWIGLVAGLFGGAIGLIAGLFGIVMALFGSGIGLTIGGIALAIGGIIQMAITPLLGVVMTGVGAILAAVGVLLLLLFVLLAFQWIPALIRIIIKACKGASHAHEGGNEI